MMNEGTAVQQGECMSNIFKFSFEFGWTEGCVAAPELPDTNVELTLQEIRFYSDDLCQAEIVQDQVKYVLSLVE